MAFSETSEEKAYLDAVGTTTPYSEDYRAGVKWVNLLEDVAASVAEGEMVRSSWIRSLVGVEDNAFFDLHDLAPVLMSTLFEAKVLGQRQGRLRPERIRKVLRAAGQD